MDREKYGDNSYDIDKLKLGRFIQQRRKELGLTQKQLARKLFVSDKAVSKWETGNALPDTGLLMPLADCLGVGVADLLAGESSDTGADVTDAEVLLRKAVSYNENLAEIKNKKGLVKITVAVCAVVLLEIIASYILTPDKSIVKYHRFASLMLLVTFVYFMIFALQRLPSYYDENRISYYVHGGVRIHMRGIVFNNSNWPHVLNALRGSTATLALGYLPFFVGLNFISGSRLFTENPGVFKAFAMIVGFTLLFSILFLPMYIAAKKYG